MSDLDKLRALAHEDPDHPHSREFRHDLLIAMLNQEPPAVKDRRLRRLRRES